MINNFRSIYTTFNTPPIKFNQDALMLKKIEHDIRRDILESIDPTLYSITRAYRKKLISFLSKANFGSAVLNYGGGQEKFVAFSNIDSSADWYTFLPRTRTLISGWNIAHKEKNPKFITQVIDDEGNKGTVNAYNRNVCTESKIIEAVATKLNYPLNGKGINGTLDLYTDRKPCASCESVLFTFSSYYPLIDIRTFYAK